MQKKTQSTSREEGALGLRVIILEATYFLFDSASSAILSLGRIKFIRYCSHYMWWIVVRNYKIGVLACHEPFIGTYIERIYHL